MAKLTEADYEKRLIAATTPHDRAAILAEFEKALAEGKVSPEIVGDVANLTEADYEKKLIAAPAPRARAAILAEFEKAVKDGRITRR